MDDSARLIFVEEGQPNAADVGHFMFLYGGVYAVAVNQLSFGDVPEWQSSLPVLEKRLRRHLDSLAWASRCHYATPPRAQPLRVGV